MRTVSLDVCDADLNVVIGPILILLLRDFERAFIPWSEFLPALKCDGSLGRERALVYQMCYMRSR